MGNLKYKESAPGTYYHLYNRGNQKRNIFKEEGDYESYIRRIISSCAKNDFTMIAYCLMPNHVHLVARQNGNKIPAKFISTLHTGYAMQFNKKYGLTGHLFQERFRQKIITGDSYMQQLIAYVHLNPIKDGFCTFPKEYRWSSYLEYARADNRTRVTDVCNHEFVEGYGFAGRTFEEFVNLAGHIEESDAFDDMR